MKQESEQELEWACEGCGDCCHIFRFPAKNKEELKRNFESIFGFRLKSYDFELVVQGECEHFNPETRKCMVYKDKPKRCTDYFCKRYCTVEKPNGELFKKRCRVCHNIRTFQAGSERDKQSVCGNCWVW